MLLIMLTKGLRNFTDIKVTSRHSLRPVIRPSALLGEQFLSLCLPRQLDTPNINFKLANSSSGSRCLSTPTLY